jgi:hypothetical protein
VIGGVADTVKGTVQRIGEAADSGRKPGMPLGVLSEIAREAPLGSLLIAFLVGVASQDEDNSPHSFDLRRFVGAPRVPSGGRRESDRKRTHWM